MWLFIQIMGLQCSVGSPFASTVSTLSSWSLKIRVDWPFWNIEHLVPGICPWVSVESSISWKYAFFFFKSPKDFSEWKSPWIYSVLVLVIYFLPSEALPVFKNLSWCKESWFLSVHLPWITHTHTHTHTHILIFFLGMRRWTQGARIVRSIVYFLEEKVWLNFFFFLMSDWRTQQR